MEIDWFTVGAQIINFFILLFLLRQFLYRPILNVIEERRDRLQAERQKLDSRDDELKWERKQIAEERQSLEATQKQRQEALQKDIEEKKRKWLEEARQDVERRRQEWLESFHTMRAEALDEFGDQLESAVLTATQTFLEALTDEELFDAFFDRFIEQLDNHLAGQQPEPDQSIVVESSESLDETQKQRLSKLLEKHLHETLELEYTVSPELSLGLRVSVGSTQFEWTVEQYLSEIQELRPDATPQEATRQIEVTT